MPRANLAPEDIDALKLITGGNQIDARCHEARQFREIGRELALQLGRAVTPSERILLRNAATLSVLCDQDTVKMLKGDPVDQENYRRNVQTLSGLMVKLGFVKPQRLQNKGDLARGDSDAFAAALLDITPDGAGNA